MSDTPSVNSTPAPVERTGDVNAGANETEEGRSKPFGGLLARSRTRSAPQAGGLSQRNCKAATGRPSFVARMKAALLAGLKRLFPCLTGQDRLARRLDEGEKPPSDAAAGATGQAMPKEPALDAAPNPPKDAAREKLEALRIQQRQLGEEARDAFRMKGPEARKAMQACLDGLLRLEQSLFSPLSALDMNSDEVSEMQLEIRQNIIEAYGWIAECSDPESEARKEAWINAGKVCDEIVTASMHKAQALRKAIDEGNDDPASEDKQAPALLETYRTAFSYKGNAISFYEKGGQEINLKDYLLHAEFAADAELLPRTVVRRTSTALAKATGLDVVKIETDMEELTAILDNAEDLKKTLPKNLAGLQQLRKIEDSEDAAMNRLDAAHRLLTEGLGKINRSDKQTFARLFNKAAQKFHEAGQFDLAAKEYTKVVRLFGGSQKAMREPQGNTALTNLQIIASVARTSAKR